MSKKNLESPDSHIVVYPVKRFILDGRHAAPMATPKVCEKAVCVAYSILGSLGNSVVNLELKEFPAIQGLWNMSLSK